jgi:redox-sensitive bicupin YhaK (pirin superfamily)
MLGQVKWYFRFFPYHARLSRSQNIKHMKTTIRKSNKRGHANHGWLDSWHTFSFADYYDPQHMGFRSLRVINQDRIAPGRGFGTHPHRNMEIFSYLVDGQLEHKDSMGNGRVLSPGQIQLMSAGSGVTHSEFNPNADQEAHLLQIWIQPRQANLTPSYTEWHPDPARENEAKVLVISPDGRDGSATIHQDADVYRLRLAAGESVDHFLRTDRGLWLQVIRGSFEVNGETVQAGDAISTETAGAWTFRASADSEALLFDLR